MDPAAGWGGGEKHEIYPEEAIFFITYFYRAGGHGTPPPGSTTEEAPYVYLQLIFKILL